MMAWGSAVQMKGFGLSLVSARYRLMAAWRSTMPLKTPRLSRCLVSLAKKPSTALSQEAEVGGKWKWNEDAARARRAPLEAYAWRSCRRSDAVPAVPASRG